LNQVVQALGLGLDPAWRRRTPQERCEDLRDLQRVGRETLARAATRD